MKACKSELARQMLRAGIPLTRLFGKPFTFDGKRYVAKLIPTR